MGELKCPKCGEPNVMKVLYVGLPMRLCSNENCTLGWGLGSYATLVFFNGYFIQYTGSYWRALWRWLAGEVHV